MFIPDTLTEAPDDDRLLMLFEKIFTAVELLDEASAVTPPPAAVEANPVMVFPFTFNAVADPVAPMVIPVIAASLLIAEMVLPAIADVFPKPFTVITVMAPVAALQLANVLLEMDFVVSPTSNWLHPVKIVAPETVILEKSFPVFVIVELTLDVAAVVKTVTVPPAAVLL